MAKQLGVKAVTVEQQREFVSRTLGVNLLTVMDLLETIVSREGFRIATAGDGEDALSKARKLLPDLIVLDLMLPKSGGFEILNALQAGDMSDIPVIIITGRHLDRSTAEMIRQQPNVREFLEKPIKSELLVSRLHQYLRTRPTK